MKRTLLAACSLLALLAPSFGAVAAEKEEKPKGSAHVRCDGAPPHMDAGEVSARLLVIMASGGLLGGGEVGDKSRRLEAEAGVAACTEALAEEPNDIRRVQLTLARAVHHIEAKNPEAALADARSVPGLAPEKLHDRGFRAGIGLGALEIEAAALARLGRGAEAEEVALKMVAAAPFDLMNLARAEQYIGLTAEMTPAKVDFYERLVRMYPASLTSRATDREWAGDWLGSARDVEALMQIYDGFRTDKEPDPPAFTARRALSYALGGDMAKANALAAEARAEVDRLMKTGEALNDQAGVSRAEELLDFQAVVRLSAEGKAEEARRAFTARSRWMAPSAPAVAVIAKRLRAGASPAELTGSLARDPDAVLAEALAAKTGALAEKRDAVALLYSGIRPYTRGDTFSGASRRVWKVDKPSYVTKRTGKEKHNGEFVYIGDLYGSQVSEALMLHCALVARKRGYAGFVLAPTRKQLNATLVRFGNPGDPGFPVEATNDAVAVIAALSPMIPPPAKH